MAKSDVVRNEILKRLIFGELQPDDRINLSELSDDDAIGTSACRSAIEELSAWRILETQPGARPRVRCVTGTELKAEAMARTAVESTLAGMIASRPRETRYKCLAKLAQVQDRMVVNARRDATIAQTMAFIFDDWEFHKLLCQMADAPFQEISITAGFWIFAISSQQSWTNEEAACAVKRDVCREHQVLLDCIERGSISNACAAVRYHLGEALIRAECDTGIAEARPTGSPYPIEFKPLFSTEFDRESLRAELGGVPVEPRLAAADENLLDFVRSLSLARA